MSKKTIFDKMCLNKKCIFPELFPLFKGPGRAHMGPYEPIWAHISDFCFNFACSGSKISFLVKFLNEFAWLCMEKLKKHSFETKNSNFDKNI